MAILRQGKNSAALCAALLEKWVFALTQYTRLAPEPKIPIFASLRDAALVPRRGKQKA